MKPLSRFIPGILLSLAIWAVLFGLVLGIHGLLCWCLPVKS